MSTYSDYFHGNVVTGDQSRSAKDLAFAIWLVRKGLTPDEIVVVLSSTEYNKGKELKDRYLERTIAKAMETVEQVHTEGTAMRLEHKPKAESSNDPAPVLLKYSEIQDIKYPEIERFSSGVQCIDEYTGGGFGLRELSLILAAQETGKTTFGCYVGGQAQAQGYNVLHVHYEDELGDIKPRYDEQMKSSGSDSEVFFLDATVKPASLESIEYAIKHSNPGFVVIDYLARIPGVNDNRFDTRDFMFKLNNLMRQYNTHIMLLDHILIEPTRTDKQGNVVPTPYKMEMHRLSEAKMYKGMVATTMIGMIVDRQDPNRIWLTGLKHKRKKNRPTLFKSITVNRETGAFIG